MLLNKYNCIREKCYSRITMTKTRQMVHHTRGVALHSPSLGLRIHHHQSITQLQGLHTELQSKTHEFISFRILHLDIFS